MTICYKAKTKTLILTFLFLFCFQPTLSLAAEDGLLAWWKFDEPQGKTLSDSSGNGMDMILTKEPYRVPGVSDNSFMFSGLDMKASSAKTANFCPTNQITISAWIWFTRKPDTRKPDGQPIYRMRHGQLTFSRGNLVLELNIAGKRQELRVEIKPEELIDRRWHLITATYDQTAMGLYKDGVEIAKKSATGNLKSAENTLAYIAGPAPGPGNAFNTRMHFQGIVDEMRIYDRGLSAEQIKGLYDAVDVSAVSAATDEFMKNFNQRHAKAWQDERNKLYHEWELERAKPLDAEARAILAMNGFMRSSPVKLPDTDGHYRVRFASRITPVPTLVHGQWDYGDCTARAVQAWIALREMTGENSIGAEVESGQKKFLLSLLHPETGLVFVPDFSSKTKNSYYYHIWGQGRTLRALVRWYIASPDDREMLKPKIDRMIRGLDKFAIVRGTDSVFGPYAGWASDVYISENPGDRVSGWTNMRVGLCIEPLVMYADFVGDPTALDLAIKFANCTLGGHEGDAVPEKDKAKFQFAPDGAFVGHLHTRTAVLIGIAKLGRSLGNDGKLEQAKPYILAARKGYDWLLSPKGGGGRIGWIPEHPGIGSSETCCGADAIELAESLAGCADFAPEYYTWTNLYGDVESMLVNIIAATQVRFTPQFESVLREEYLSYDADSEQNIKTARQLAGTWAAAFLINDLSRGDMISAGGCCQYAGVRALYTGWQNAMIYSDGDLYINYFVNSNRPYASIATAQPIDGSAKISILKDINVFIRIPEYLKPEQLIIKVNGQKIETLENRDKTGSYVALGELKRADSISVNFPMEERVTKWRGSTIQWRGNYVNGMEPAGPVYKLFPSIKKK